MDGVWCKGCCQRASIPHWHKVCPQYLLSGRKIRSAWFGCTWDPESPLGFWLNYCFQKGYVVSNGSPVLRHTWSTSWWQENSTTAFRSSLHLFLFSQVKASIRNKAKTCTQGQPGPPAGQLELWLSDPEGLGNEVKETRGKFLQSKGAFTKFSALSSVKPAWHSFEAQTPGSFFIKVPLLMEVSHFWIPWNSNCGMLLCLTLT